MGPFAFDTKAAQAKNEILDALSIAQGAAPQQPMMPRPQMPPQQPQMGVPMQGMPMQGMPMQPQMGAPMQPQMPQGMPMQPQMAARPQMGMQPQMAVPRRFKEGGAVRGEDLAVLRDKYAEGGGAWTRKEGKNPEGGLNAKGRASLKAQGQDIKPPVSSKQAAKSPKAAARRKSFCARMGGMEGPMKDEQGRPTRKALALRKWDCKAEGGAVKPIWEKDRPEDLGKPKGLSVKKKAFAKRRAKAAGRPYPNMVDNLAAARKKGK
jgi:hypothetical protein